MPPVPSTPTSRRPLIAIIGAVLIMATILILLVVEISGHYSRAASLPTLAVLPSDTPTPLATASATPTAASTSKATFASTFTLSPTPFDSATPTNTATVVEATATAEPTDVSATTLTDVVRVKVKAGSPVRNGPGLWFDALEGVNNTDPYLVQAYAKDFYGATWYLIILPDAKTAWVFAASTEIVSGKAAPQIALAVTIPPMPTLTPTFTLTPAADHLESQLQAIPVLSDISPTMRDLYLKGQKLGDHGNVFAKVGDCNTESDSFMRPLDNGTYRLGPYSPLQKTVSFFKGSFARESIAGQIGFNVITVQDSLWANPKYCGANESPLNCEYRLLHPSIAVVMFGANDVLFLTPKLYESHLRQIVEQSLNQGIIPVLTTFTWHDYDTQASAKVMEFNLIIARLAQEYQIPLINFWLASQYLPEHGINRDNAHLSFAGDGLQFTGDETRWGHSLRSLLTLQMLDKLRTALGEDSSAAGQ
ncbi:MAG: SGNH/GDSL hydrolase family protein [Chloroflexota bacterium]